MEDSGFIKRFIEVCGTSQPARIQQLLNISYQAAKNYLKGRVPETKILKIIAERTPYSIHWLVTGDGKKFVDQLHEEDTAPLSREMEASFRRICREEFHEMNKRQGTGAKVVVLNSRDVLSEKIADENTSISSDTH